MAKKITVIVPIYNTAEFLEQCINSVLNQTYNNLEILLINDGSTDRSKEVIESFSKIDNRVVCHDFVQRKGVGAARNFGLEKATGDYVYFLDSDDYIEKSTLQLLVENIGDYQIISGKTKKINKANEAMQIEENNYEVLIYKKKRTKLFKNRTMLNRLISIDFIRENQLKFSEDVKCYSDFSLIVPILEKIDTMLYLKQAIYFKRKRNDPITNPSLSQLGREERIVDFLKIYSKLKQQYSDFWIATKYLDSHFLNYYRRTIILFFKDSQNMNDYFNEVSKSAKLVDNKILKRKHFVIRKEIKQLMNEQKSKYSNSLKWHLRFSEIKKALKGRTNLYNYFYRSIFMQRPMKENRIVFESFLGKNYSDSPKYIYEYMVKENMDYEYIWIFNEPGKKIPGNAKQIKRFSIAYYYYLATSKYWVSNSRMPLRLKKREGNIYLQTWHGTPLKKLVFDMNDVHSANPNYKKHFYLQSRRWDYLISPNQYSSDIFRRAFKFNKEMLEFGYPRNDILYSPNKLQITKTIKERLGIPVDKKIILYAPTWRDDEFYQPGKYKFDLKLDLYKLKEELGNDYVIVLRMHYFIADEIETSGLDNFAFNLSKYDDIAELYLLSDILITDYSSVFFDYANLQRPILFYAYDLEKYRDTLRGFYINIEEEVPGPILKTTDAVIESIKNIDLVNEKYKEKYDKFYNRFCNWDNGKAAKNVVERVFK
ncbi:teichoic acid biosynthesis protein F [Heyndrickxia sporothermodurans]|uniref:bifunctional glycosyltransferase/CDP-glycerol:glycerophosphate glycerophosphotransferase n=1 Tax=Heyndrickxia sporothermodurans TaxID=46224 RepID=UPI000D33A480|nr:CDP-glycerol:glycerophosphate glycerophosphotransferase [Heyndrickxia sporothermodurans]PTY80820.1 teichoic acid biosynthesis protein F [Heyndrickxia sporothermodurans]